NPLDVVFIVAAVPLLWFAVRARPKTWELVSLVLLALATVHVGRNSVWLVLFVAAPAACGLRFRAGAPARGVLLAGAWVVAVVLVQVDGKAQDRLARNDAFREVGRDAVAVLYRRAS